LSLESFSPWLLGCAALAMGLALALLLVWRRCARNPDPAPVAHPVAPPDEESRRRLRAWLVAAPVHAVTLQRVLLEHRGLRVRADAAEHALTPLRERVEQAEQRCETLRYELSQSREQLEGLRKDWDDVTQQVSQLLLQLLDKKHDDR
jgi:hypothetical protein